MPVIQVGEAKVDVEQSGAGRDLVLLHSLLADRTVFSRVVPLLSRKRRVTLVSLPGYDASSPAGPAVEDYAERIAGLISMLRLPRETDVLGNGFGGFIAVALAARHGGLFDRLIAAPALGAFPEAAKQPFHRLAALVSSQGMTAVLDIAVRRMFPQGFIEKNPALVEERKRALAKVDPACFRTACLALASLDLSGVLSGIKNTTLVMAGSEDATTPTALARQLAAGIAGAKFVELAGCGHCPQLEDPQKFVAEVERFLG